jgi:hypothetical protein
METDAQAQLFEAWYREAITDGVDWFFMKLQTPLGVQFYKCRFTDIYQGPTLVARFTGSFPQLLSCGNDRFLMTAGRSSWTTSSTAALSTLRLTGSGLNHDHTEQALCQQRRRGHHRDVADQYW